MIRRVQLSLNESNTSKLFKLDLIMDESLRLLNLYVDHFWNDKKARKFDSLSIIESWLSARLRRCLFIQAFDVVSKLRAKKLRKTSKPVIKQQTLCLTELICSVEFDINSFDCWVHLSSVGDKIILSLPSRKHKHFNKFYQNGWELKKSTQLRKINGKWFLDVFFEKETTAPVSGTAVGLDCGYKKLLAASDGLIYDNGLSSVYAKITSKRQGSKAFKQALIERDHLINRSIKLIDTSSIGTIVVEDLKNVKKSTKGKLRKSFVNRLQRWSYAKVLNKLQLVCEESGIRLIRVDPAYTSQTCSRCGECNKLSRQGESFRCVSCGMEMDADINAAKNILQRGVYSPPSMHKLDTINSNGSATIHQWGNEQ
jgi:IS605 OrfB family transposase